LGICGLGFSVRKVGFFEALIRFSPETNVLTGVLLSAASAMNIFDLPPVYATLDGLSTCLIAAGWSAVRRSMSSE